LFGLGVFVGKEETMELQDRVAVITGSGRGIGKAIARELAQLGARVVVAELADYGEQAVQELRAQGAEATYAKVDVADSQSVAAMVTRARDKYGRIDVLVNNAGIRPTCPVLEMSRSDWERVLAVNLTGTFNCCTAVAPFMAAQRWGRIVNISSLAAQRGSTGGHSHYAAAKAGIVGFSKSLARELAPVTVTVNVVAPGWIDTEGWEGQLDGQREAYAGRVPLGRLGQPEDVAYAVAFLVSERASYLTGITLPVNGGLFIY
jgi:NAD(P)-dependent dehydrogenase (short-subunit alcohol dehydrogenase family)